MAFKKQKKIGEFITSEGFRRTIHKVVYYYSMMIFGLLFDFLNPFSYYFPYPISILPIITILFGIVLVYTEAKSVREKAEDKLRRKTDSSIIDIVETVKNNKEVMNNLIEFLKNKQNENNNTDSNPPAAN